MSTLEGKEGDMVTSAGIDETDEGENGRENHVVTETFIFTLAQ